MFVIVFFDLDTQLTGDFDPNSTPSLSSGLYSALFGNSRIFVLASHGLFIVCAITVMHWTQDGIFSPRFNRFLEYFKSKRYVLPVHFWYIGSGG